MFYWRNEKFWAKRRVKKTKKKRKRKTHWQKLSSDVLLACKVAAAHRSAGVVHEINLNLLRKLFELNNN